MTAEKGSKDYELLREKYEEWHKGYCNKAIELNASYDAVDFETRQTTVIDADFEETTEVTLEELIEAFVEEQIRGGNWTTRRREPTAPCSASWLRSRAKGSHAAG